MLTQMQIRNDIFRKAVLSLPRLKYGKMILTQGVAGLPDGILKQVLNKIRTESDFPSGNDPHKEHDFGVVESEEHPKVYWKIDYYENSNCDIPENEEWGEDPKDFWTAYRVMTIMLAEEY